LLIGCFGGWVDGTEDLALVRTTKSSEKFSEVWQNFQTSENSTDFSDCVPIKISEEKSAEILPASSTKKLVRNCFRFSGKICGY
jgi:hypothetical protein